ncbi:MAG TPA: alpha/beta family hydrolase [Gammaproteobacteria bacterium]|nr:alpha/beta family hydrolase [Gammaproteobacteria bacterium]
MDFLFTGPASAPLTLALAHGAGVGMDSPFMAAVASGLGERGWRVARFEFPYMVRRRAEGTKRPPDRQPVLLDTWREVIDELGAQRLVIGGKSMGGRMASLVADEAGVAGLVGLGYPFHPPGKPDRTRIEHLQRLATPALIVQGSRDPFGTREEVASYPLDPAIAFHWAEDGNHDLAPRKRSGRTAEDNLSAALDAVDGFLRGVAG